MKTEPMVHQEKELKEHGLDKVRAIFWEQGCFSGDTEYLSPEGWCRIDQYNGGDVAQWDQASGAATFVTPSEYVVKDCEEMVRIKTKYGVDMKVSPGHRMPYLTKHGKKPKEAAAAVMVEELTGSSSAFRHLPSTFSYMPEGFSGIPVSLSELRLQVAVMADGHFPGDSLGTNRCIIRIKKQRKIDRLLELLRFVGKQPKDNLDQDSYTVRESNEFQVFTFYAPMRIKKYPASWIHAQHQEKLTILDEILKWDGTTKHCLKFFSKHESDADIVQTLFASIGKVARKSYGHDCWEVSVRKDTTPFTVRRGNFSLEPTDDGKMYCFCVPTGFLVMRRNGCIFPSGNTGKTWLALAEAEMLYKAGEIDALFIIAPNGLHTNWVIYEIPDHLEVEHKALAYRTKKANTKRHQKEVQEILDYTDGLAIFAMSYDAIKTKKGKEWAKKFLTKRKCFYVADESNRIKTPKAKTTITTIQSGTYSEYKRILCGTPITNTPFDVYAQFRFLEKTFWKETPYGLSTFGDFKTFFGIWRKMVNHKQIDPRTQKPREFDMLVDYKNLHILCKLVKGMSSRVLKEDVLNDLPDKLYTYKGFDLTPEQARHYVMIEEEFMTEIEGEFVFTPLAITRLLRLQQIICGYLPSGDEGDCILIGDKNPRLDLCLEICNDLPHKALIWCRFIKDIDLLSEALGDKAVRWDGTVGDDEREDNKYRFKKSPVNEVQFMIATPDSMGEGHTLNEALTTIYYSNSYKLKERLQSEDRNHRKGQKNAVNYIDLVANNTQDLIILEALRGKFDNASQVIDGRLRTWLLTYEQEDSMM